MKKLYLKPEAQLYTILESGGIMNGISGNTINGVTDEKNRDPQLEGGGTGDGTDMGANNGFFSYEDDFHYDAWSDW